MVGRHSDLLNEFPEHKDAILALKNGDSHFQELCHTYEEVDVAVTRAEEGIDHLSRQAEEDLKRERVKLKDEIYVLIRSH